VRHPQVSPSRAARVERRAVTRRGTRSRMDIPESIRELAELLDADLEPVQPSPADHRESQP
jgi:hypothetical protein